MSEPTGVLLVNLGTPDAPTPAALRRYLREFLMDGRVIDLPTVARWLLVPGVILPRRPRRSAAAYRAIWSEAGSPLLVHSQALAGELQTALGPDYRVELGMRYGTPSMAEALDRLLDAGVADGGLVLAALFPHKAEATTGSGLALSEELFAERGLAPPRVVPPFYAEPGFARAWRAATGDTLRAFAPDHVLLSYHGLPERQVQAADATGKHCLRTADCCAQAGPAAANCYRAQCLATTHALIPALQLEPDQVSSSFQSRLGRTPWIRPYTDEVLPQLAESGVRRLAVACPSFAVDCLETLEEIGIRAREQWLGLGGEAFELLPCPNAQPVFAAALAEWVRSAAQGASVPAAATPLAKASGTDTPSV